ncbi:MAG: ATP-binding protein [Phycisphaerales bacterium]
MSWDGSLARLIKRVLASTIALRDRTPFRVRVAGALAVCLAPAVLVVAYSSVTLSATLADSEHEADVDDVGKDAALAAGSALQVRRYEKDVLLSCRDLAAQDEYVKLWKQACAETLKVLQEISGHTAPNSPLADAPAHESIQRLLDGFPEYQQTVEQLVAESRAQHEPDAVVLNNRLSAYKQVVRDAITVCQELNSTYTDRALPAEEAVHEGLGKLATTLAVSSVITAALGFVSVLLISSVLTRRIRRLGRFVDAVRAGDLDARVTVGGADEIGRLSLALNKMLDELSQSTARERAAAVAETEAREGGELKMRFLANMSHEIRTPMTAILGFTDLLLDPKLSVQNRMAYTETIRRNGNHLLGLINDVLDLSKIQAEKMALSVGPAHVCKLVAEAAAMVRVRAAEKNLPLNVVYEFPIPEHIQTDALRLRQVLVNLLSNAVKFTENGAVKLTARADGLNAPTPHITFIVADSGVGMSAEQVAGLFHAFSQVDDSATRRFGGTGLGLCISKELVERLGGSMRVESTRGVGTTFTVQMPVGDVKGMRLVYNAEEALAETSTPPPIVAATKLQGRILLAEDGPDNQRLIKLVLAKAGAEVDVVENGQLALDAALAAERDGRPYDLVLMDMQMPVMDGYSATSGLRERGYRRPIVALTAHAMPHDRQRCLLAGCDDYTTKPIDRSVFLPLVQGFMGSTPAAAAA